MKAGSLQLYKPKSCIPKTPSNIQNMRFPNALSDATPRSTAQVQKSYFGGLFLVFSGIFIRSLAVRGNSDVGVVFFGRSWGWAGGVLLCSWPMGSQPYTCRIFFQVGQESLRDSCSRSPSASLSFLMGLTVSSNWVSGSLLARKLALETWPMIIIGSAFFRLLCPNPSIKEHVFPAKF